MSRRFLSRARSARRSGVRCHLDSLEARLFLSADAGVDADLLAADYDPTTILVRFKDPDSAAAVPGTSVGKALGLDRALHEVHLGGGVDVAKALAAYRHNPMVDYAEPNWLVTTQATSTDPYFTDGSLWGMYGDASSPANQYGSQAAEAWAAGNTGSKDVYVGIIDEGINFAHPDLAANVWSNSFDTADGIDNDSNGYIDDIHGWDFVSNDNSIYDGTQDDHGTHVTGTIAASANNAGVVGMNWDVTYISGKFLGRRGGTTADAVEAVDYMTDLKTRHGLNIVALNNSWSGGAYSQALLDAIGRAAKQNILFIAAASNGGSDQVGDNNDSAPVYPASYNTTAIAGYDSVIAVAAINSSGGLASFSNYGAKTVDLGAPGVSVNSTLPEGAYGSYSGTSMATPHVTGAAALFAAAYAAKNGKVPTASQIREALLTSAAPTSSLAGKTATGGRLDVASAIAQLDTTPPAAPSGLTATPTTGTPIQLAWADNANNEIGFRIERSADGVSFAPIATVAANTTSYRDADPALQPATTYTYRVCAYNGGGDSGYTVPVSATTANIIPDGTGNGLIGQYYDYTTNNTSVAPDPTLAFSATNLKLTRTDAQINFNWGSKGPIKRVNDTYAVRWTGFIETKYAETYNFRAYADDGVYLYIDNNLVIDGWRINWGNLPGSAFLTRGIHTFKLEYFENTGDALIQLYWSSPSQPEQLIPKSQLYTSDPRLVQGSTFSPAPSATPAEAALPLASTATSPFSKALIRPDVWAEANPQDPLAVG